MPPRRHRPQTPFSGNRERRPSSTPRIQQMQNQGLTRQQILDRLNGEKNLRDLTRGQLEAIGFVDKRVDSYLALQERRNRGAIRPDPSKDGGEGNGNQGEFPTEEPFDPMADYWAQQQEQQRESAFSMMAGLLDQYGLGSLTPFLQGLITGGQTDPATLQLELQNTPEWKQRFKGNEILRQKGLGVLSPAEYLNLERSYASVMRQFGLPAGFFDSNEDFVNFIGNGVSPQELADRAEKATTLAKQVDPTQRQLLSSMYGIGEGDIAAFFLDAKRATPVLQKTVDAIQTASAAKRVGINADYGNAERWEKLNERGVNPQMAQQGYGIISNELDPLKNLASIWGKGNNWTLEESEDATFFNDGRAQRERKGLIDQERAAFSGRSGFDSRVSGRRSSAGQF